jgi:hypothetical protein
MANRNSNSICRHKKRGTLPTFIKKTLVFFIFLVFKEIRLIISDFNNLKTELCLGK